MAARPGKGVNLKERIKFMANVVETLDKLERRITISLPRETVQKEAAKRGGNEQESSGNTGGESGVMKQTSLVSF